MTRAEYLKEGDLFRLKGGKIIYRWYPPIWRNGSTHYVYNKVNSFKFYTVPAYKIIEVILV